MMACLQKIVLITVNVCVIAELLNANLIEDDNSKLLREDGRFDILILLFIVAR